VQLQELSKHHSYLLITNCTRGRAISYTNSHGTIFEVIIILELSQNTHHQAGQVVRLQYLIRYVSILNEACSYPNDKV
jgi:hypothetical protein